MTSGQQLMGDNSNLGGIERRTVVRAGAWSVPVVAVSATAPAFASSTGLKIDPFTAAYENQGTATMRPDRLVVGAMIQNNGGPSTSGLTFDVFIPRGSARFGIGELYDDNLPTLPTPVAGWSFAATLLTVAANPTYKFRLRFTRTGTQPTGGGGKVTLPPATVQFQLASNPPSPFKPFVGSAYTVNGVASATNVPTSASKTASVDESATAGGVTTTLLTVNSFSAVRSGTSLTVRGGPTTGMDHNNIGAVSNAGRKTCGPVSFKVVVPFVAGHRYYGAAPATVTATGPTGWSNGAVSGSGPWTYTFVSSSPLAPSAISGNSVAQANTPDFGNTVITLTDSVTGGTTTQSITASATASFGATTATASDPDN